MICAACLDAVEQPLALMRSAKQVAPSLLRRLHRHEAHRLTTHRYANAFRVCGVSFATFNEWLNLSRRNQSAFVPQCGGLAGPMVRVATVFHSRLARPKLSKEGQHFRSPQLDPQYRRAFGGSVRNLKNILGRIKPDCSDISVNGPLALWFRFIDHV